MTGRTLSLQRWLTTWDTGPGRSLALRFGLTLLLFQAWQARFVASPFAMEDVEPDVLAIARAQGIDLLSKAAWPTWQGHLFRVLVYFLVLAILWWGLSRLRIRMCDRDGFGGLALVGLLGAFILVNGVATLGAAYFRHGAQEAASRAPAWGGWVHYHLFGYFGSLLAWRFAVVAMGLEGLLLAFGHRLHLADARDGALRARLAPHFFFNALNTLHAQIEEDPAGAQETTERMAGLFRQVVEVTEQATVPLSRELSFVEDYLGIQRQRLGDRLKVSVDVSEAALCAQVPVLALQVLVENAIRHGVEPRVAGGAVTIQARLEGRRLTVAVTDPGDGTSHQAKGSGKALANLRARLARPRDLVLEPVLGGFQARFTFLQA